MKIEKRLNQLPILEMFEQLPVFDKKIIDVMEEFLDTFDNTIVSKINYPPTNLYFVKDKNKWILEIVVAGFKKDDIKIKILNGVVEDSILEVSAEKLKDDTKDNDNIKYQLRKISKKGFKIDVPFSTSIDNVDAKLQDGILKIEIGFKKPENKIKTIEIKD